jgi:DNA polymerase
MTTLRLDWESRSKIDLFKRGLDVYSADPSTRILMGAYGFDQDPPKLWQRSDGPIPRELREALLDPHVEKRAFNAQFERVMARRVAKIATPYEGWRCTMVLGFMQSFVGNLDAMGRQVGLPQDQQKLKEGKRLINLFCKPQKVTKKNPHLWRDEYTDPDDWALFCDYCLQDIVAEDGIHARLKRYDVCPEEWALYEMDQRINDRGLPIDMDFVNNAIVMGARRKRELTEELIDLTGLKNPNSPKQLQEWLLERGYPFNDLRKDTVKKVLTENAEAAGVELSAFEDDLVELETYEGGYLDPDAVKALLIRQQVARTSVKKYDAIARLVGPGDRLRFGFQMGGASRTNRWAGRGLNPQNLTRTPPDLEVSKAAKAAGVSEDFLMAMVTDFIRDGDYEGVRMSIKEPMNALAGLVRSAIRAPEGYELLACDLSSIETCVIAWLSNAKRLLNVFRRKAVDPSAPDPYEDFASIMYKKDVKEVTRKERQNSKPGVLGAGFRLGGGELDAEGKRTGLWGYAEGMGINMTQEEANLAVHVFRKEAYPEIPYLWYALEDAARIAMQEPGRRVRPIVKYDPENPFLVPVYLEYKRPYLSIYLPSGRPIRYFKPQLAKVTMRDRQGHIIYNDDGEPWKKWQLSYMGKQQNGQAWVRVYTHGGKLTENIVQAAARDVLVVGLMRAMKAGFPIIGHVHDELINLVRRFSNEFTLERLRELMTADIPWAKGLPLGAAGWQAVFYRKD